jgi:trans-aconitate methyltransferase
MTTSDAQEPWSQFYRANEGRAPRPLFVEALAHIVERPALAVRCAADLGCGDGTEALALLQRRWHVLAIDQQPEAMALVRRKVPPALQQRLVTRLAPFETLELPLLDFIYAGFSLPFCAPQHFSQLWNTIVTALPSGGIFAGQLFGVHDTWATNTAMTFHTHRGKVSEADTRGNL